MKKDPLTRLSIFMALVTFGAANSVCSAAVAVDPHGFDDTDLGGWTTGAAFAPPKLETRGGPLGDSDPFLLVSGAGGNGPGSVVALYNEQSNWIGDFDGITGLSVDLLNPSTSNPLEIRLVVFGPTSTSNRWTSVDSNAVQNDGQWQNYFFPIDQQSLTSVLGNASFDEVISGATRLMIRHDPGTPSSGGAPIQAQLGVDNIGLVASLLGDYNNNGQLDTGDLDMMAAGIIAGDAAFDLDGNGIVEPTDRTTWIRDLQHSWVGDSNFDGEFNSSDFVAVFAVGKYETGREATYAEGDWNGDQVFSSSDFIIAFGDGGFERGPRGIALVPEPTSLLLIGFGWLSGVSIFRYRVQ